MKKKNEAASAFGRMGARARILKHGKESLRKMQQKGGAAILAVHGPEYYKELNRKSQDAKRAKKANKQGT